MSARRWLIDNGSAFLDWRAAGAVRQMETFATAVNETISEPHGWECDASQVTLRLPDVLRHCDSLAFIDDAEIRAYAALHLVDRFGRVWQVLEYMVAAGRLPLRRRGVSVLEVGSGPAPALYATRDFYNDVVSWPAQTLEVGAVRLARALDRGPGWHRLLHRLSEHLMVVRGERTLHGALPFGVAHSELKGFDVRDVHHKDIASLTQQIMEEFDRADDPISQATARRFAYEDGVGSPSAYDLVFVPNFLTQPEIIDSFNVELRKLARSLTPGGLLIVLTATGQRYVQIQNMVAHLATSAGLVDISPALPFKANNVTGRLEIVAKHVRTTVRELLDKSPDQLRSEIRRLLPLDITNEQAPFSAPQFKAMIFQNWRPAHR